MDRTKKLTALVISGSLSDILDNDTADKLVDRLITVWQVNNEPFDEKAFREACGVKDWRTK